MTSGIAIVGTGFGCLTHVPAFRAAGFEVRALVGRDPAKTAERAALLEIPHAFTSFAQALALPGVDAVSIVTPPHTHAAFVTEAVAAGRHVLCEKPFALDASGAQRMLDAASAAGVVHMVGNEFRFSVEEALLRRTIQAGLIGEPRLATILLHIPLLADPAGEIPSWWQSSDSGGGWLGAHASHVIDQVRITLGDFSGVSAGLSRLADRPGMTADDSFTVHFRAGTVDGVMQSTAASWGRLLITTRIAGTSGTAWLKGQEVWLADSSGSRRLEVPADLELPEPEPPRPEFLKTAYEMLHFTGSHSAPYTRLASAFHDRILGKPTAPDPVPATFADGLATMRVLDAIRQSSAARTWIPLSGTS